MNKSQGQFYLHFTTGKLGCKTPRTVSTKKRERIQRTARDSSRENVEYKVPLVSLDDQLKMMPKFLNSQRITFRNKELNRGEFETESPYMPRIKDPTRLKLNGLRKVSDLPKFVDQYSLDNTESKQTTFGLPTKVKYLIGIKNNLSTVDLNNYSLESLFSNTKQLLEYTQISDKNDEGYGFTASQYLSKLVIDSFSNSIPYSKIAENISKWMIYMINKISIKISVKHVLKLELIHTMFYLSLKELEKHSVSEAFAFTWKVISIYQNAMNYSKISSIKKVSQIESEFHKKIAMIDSNHEEATNMEICYQAQTDQNAMERLKSNAVIYKMQIVDLKKQLLDKDEELKLINALKNDVHQKLNEITQLNTQLKRALKMPTMKNKEQMSKAYEFMADTCLVNENSTQTAGEINLLEMLGNKAGKVDNSNKDEEVQVHMIDMQPKPSNEVKEKSPEQDFIKMLNKPKEQEDKRRDVIIQFNDSQKKLQQLLTNSKDTQTDAIEEPKKVEQKETPKETKVKYKESKEQKEDKRPKIEYVGLQDTGNVAVKAKKAEKPKKPLTLKIEILDNFAFHPPHISREVLLEDKNCETDIIEEPLPKIEVRADTPQSYTPISIMTEQVDKQCEQIESNTNQGGYIKRYISNSKQIYIAMPAMIENIKEVVRYVEVPTREKSEISVTPTKKPIIKKEVAETPEQMHINLQSTYNDNETNVSKIKLQKKVTEDNSNTFKDYSPNQTIQTVSPILRQTTFRDDISPSLSLKEEILQNARAIKEYTKEITNNEDITNNIADSANNIIKAMQRNETKQSKLKHSETSFKTKINDDSNSELQMTSLDHKMINSIMSIGISRNTC